MKRAPVNWAPLFSWPRRIRGRPAREPGEQPIPRAGQPQAGLPRKDRLENRLRGRIAIGVVSLLAPGFVGRIMTGPDRSEGGTRLFACMVGARDVGLGSGLLVALDRGAPVRVGSKCPLW